MYLLLLHKSMHQPTMHTGQTTLPKNLISLTLSEARCAYETVATPPWQLFFCPKKRKAAETAAP